jgi:hypothetical protein
LFCYYCNKSYNIVKRLTIIAEQYKLVAYGIEPDLFVVEMMGRNTHPYTVWSIGAIASKFNDAECQTTTAKKMGTEVPIACWKRVYNIDLYGNQDQECIRVCKKLYPKEKIESADEAVAILIGGFYNEYIKNKEKFESSGKIRPKLISQEVASIFARRLNRGSKKRKHRTKSTNKKKNDGQIKRKLSKNGRKRS